MDNPDEYAVLAAVWILASNDAVPLITYRGVLERLNLPTNWDLRGLVGRHGELFRKRMPPSVLNEWKEEMRAGKRRPAWIREVAEPERTRLIESLTPDDGFRSQFRSEIGAPRSDIAVIEWGLNHIERLRKARSEALEATAKSWQMWLVFAVGVLGVFATIIAAIVKK